MRSDSQKKADRNYRASKTKSLSITLFTSTESDIIDKLDSVDSKAGYIKQLIRDDINKNNENK